MFNGDSALVGGKSVRLKTKLVKALRKSLGTAFPRLLAPIGINPLVDKDGPSDAAQSALDVLVPVKSAVNRVTFKDKTCLFKVCYDNKVKDSSSVFVPLFLQLKRKHEIIPTIFALWRVPDLLRISFVTIPPVSSKLIKPAPADLFFPGVVSIKCTNSDDWEQGELCSLFVHRNPFAFAVGRTGQTSYAAAAVARKGVAAVVVHSYLDKIWQMERLQPAGFQETDVVPCIAPEPIPEPPAEVGDGEASAVAPEETEPAAAEAAAGTATSTEASSGAGAAPSAASSPDVAAPSAASSPDVAAPSADASPAVAAPSTDASSPAMASASTAASSLDDIDAIPPALPAASNPTEAEAEPSAIGGEQHEEEEAASDAEDSMDDLMFCTLFQALQKVPKAELPLLANVFMGKYFLPSRPANTVLKVKQTTWGQFGKFLEAMSHIGVLQLTKHGATSVMAIAAINADSLRDHSPHVDQAEEDARQQQLQSGSVGSLFGASANQSAGGGKLKIVQLYRPPDQAKALFETVLENQKAEEARGEAARTSVPLGAIFRTGTKLRPKRLYSHAAIMAVLGLYVGRQNLSDPADKKFVRLDALLRRAVFKKKSVAERVSRAQLARELLSRMESFYHVSRNGDDHPRGYVPVARMGRIPQVIITVERNRQRREKFLTRVAGLDSFGVDVDQLASEGTKIFACAISARKNPSTPKSDKSKELLVHGNMADTVMKVLVDDPYQIPRKYLVVKRHADKKKKKKKKK